MTDSVQSPKFLTDADEADRFAEGALAQYKDANGKAQVVASATPLPVTQATPPVGGGITWGALMETAADGSSKNLVAANASRRAIRIWNPVGNSQMNYDLAGGTVTAAKGTPLMAGDVDWFVGAACPVGAITFIGTNGQKLVYQEGT